MSMAENLSRELIDKIAQLYITANIPLSKMVYIVKETFQVEVTYRRLQDLSLAEGWEHRKIVYQNSRKNGGGESETITQEVSFIRQAVFNQIIASAQGGILISGVEYDDVVSAFDGPNVKISKVSPVPIDSALINAYMNLLSKSNIKLGVVGTAKTDLQQAIDLFRSVAEDE